MIPLVVIADDLTGAADTGIQFLKLLNPIYLVSVQQVSRLQSDTLPAALSVYTDTRNMAARQAARLVANTAQALMPLQPGRIYKKIDSCMRGNVGAELDAILDEFNLHASLIAPAFPLQGRTTVNNIHYVNGVPVSESEMGQDARNPVSKSTLTDLVAEKSKFKVGHIDLNDLSQPVERIIEKVNALFETGVRHVVFDAQKQRHLDLIADLAIHHVNNSLPVGSAGLAESISSSLSQHRPLNKQRHLKKPELQKGNILFICGSVSAIIKSQVKELIQNSKSRLMRIDPHKLADVAQADKNQQKKKLGDEVAHLLESNDLVLQIDSDTKIAIAMPGEQLVKGLAEIVSSALKITAVGGLFVSGGDTAAAVLNIITDGPLQLETEVTSGLVWGTIIQGPLSGMPVVTKAGAFGQSNALIELYRIWKTALK